MKWLRRRISTTHYGTFHFVMRRAESDEDLGIVRAHLEGIEQRASQPDNQDAESQEHLRIVRAHVERLERRASQRDNQDDDESPSADSAVDDG